MKVHRERSTITPQVSVLKNPDSRQQRGTLAHWIDPDF